MEFDVMRASINSNAAADLPIGERNADRTRGDLLLAAEHEMHLRGFQAASLSKILEETGVTKGALYHHFSSKKALGYAVVDEVWGPFMRQMWVEPLENEGNPLDILIETIMTASSSMSDEDLLLGCPLNNISQEMSPIDEGFRERINGLLVEWCNTIQQALEKGQSNGFVTQRVSAAAVATMLVASLEGCIGMAKNAQSNDLLIQCGTGVIDYINTLRS